MVGLSNVLLSASARILEFTYLYASDTNVSNFVSVKLSGSGNYLVWKTQMMCLLDSNNMCGIVDATFVAPRYSSPKTMRQYDCLVRGWIFGSVSEDVLVDVYNLDSAKAVWETLKSIYDPTVCKQQVEDTKNVDWSFLLMRFPNNLWDEIDKLEYSQTHHPYFTRSQLYRQRLVKVEQSVKDTTESCSIIATLITAIVFAAGISVPDASNQETRTRFRFTSVFILFVISDAISLFASTMALLVFLCILTACFDEKDFLVSLPRRLFIGLFFLLVSVTAMMVAFSAILFLVLCDQTPWTLARICGMTFFPIAFVTLQFPVMVDLFRSTYLGIFGKHMKNQAVRDFKSSKDLIEATFNQETILKKEELLTEPISSDGNTVLHIETDAGTEMGNSSNPLLSASARIQHNEFLFASNTNVSSFVSVKLSGKNNYYLWKSQMVYVLDRQNVCGMVDSTFGGPRYSGTETMRRYDSLVRGWIFGSVSEDVLVNVFNLGSAKAVWEKLKSIYDPTLCFPKVGYIKKKEWLTVPMRLPDNKKNAKEILFRSSEPIEGRELCCQMIQLAIIHDTEDTQNSEKKETKTGTQEMDIRDGKDANNDVNVAHVSDDRHEILGDDANVVSSSYVIEAVMEPSDVWNLPEYVIIPFILEYRVDSKNMCVAVDSTFGGPNTMRKYDSLVRHQIFSSIREDVLLDVFHLGSEKTVSENLEFICHPTLCLPKVGSNKETEWLVVQEKKVARKEILLRSPVAIQNRERELGIIHGSEDTQNSENKTTETGKKENGVGYYDSFSDDTGDDDEISFGASRSIPLDHQHVATLIQGMLGYPDLEYFHTSQLNVKSDVYGFGVVLAELITGKKPIAVDKAVSEKKIAAYFVNSIKEFLEAEVDFLGRLSLPNLVKLFGYCYDDAKLLLVYEFMPKGSLENYLSGRGLMIRPLPWVARLKISIGAARGLAFLHTSGKQVIYRDFKASKILLDRSYNAKIFDYGLGKVGPSASQSHVTTRVMGTYGYAAPEYVSTEGPNITGAGIIPPLFQSVKATTKGDWSEVDSKKQENTALHIATRKGHNYDFVKNLFSHINAEQVYGKKNYDALNALDIAMIIANKHAVELSVFQLHAILHDMSCESGGLKLDGCDVSGRSLEFRNQELLVSFDVWEKLKFIYDPTLCLPKVENIKSKEWPNVPMRVPDNPREQLYIMEERNRLFKEILFISPEAIQRRDNFGNEKIVVATIIHSLEDTQNTENKPIKNRTKEDDSDGAETTRDDDIFCHVKDDSDYAMDDKFYVIKLAMMEPFEVKNHHNLLKYFRPFSLDDPFAFDDRARSVLDLHSSNRKGLQGVCGISGKKLEGDHAKTSFTGNVRIEATSSQSSMKTSDVYDGSIACDNCYKSQPCEDDHFTPMTEDMICLVKEIEGSVVNSKTTKLGWSEAEATQKEEHSMLHLACREDWSNVKSVLMKDDSGKHKNLHRTIVVYSFENNLMYLTEKLATSGVVNQRTICEALQLQLGLQWREEVKRFTYFTKKITIKVEEGVDSVDLDRDREFYDFGLVKGGHEVDKTLNSTQVMGTYDCAAPEYASIAGCIGIGNDQKFTKEIAAINTKSVVEQITGDHLEKVWSEDGEVQAKPKILYVCRQQHNTWSPHISMKTNTKVVMISLMLNSEIDKVIEAKDHGTITLPSHMDHENIVKEGVHSIEAKWGIGDEYNLREATINGISSISPEAIYKRVNCGYENFQLAIIHRFEDLQNSENKKKKTGTKENDVGCYDSFNDGNGDDVDEDDDELIFGASSLTSSDLKQVVGELV